MHNMWTAIGIRNCEFQTLWEIIKNLLVLPRILHQSTTEVIKMNRDIFGVS